MPRAYVPIVNPRTDELRFRGVRLTDETFALLNEAVAKLKAIEADIGERAGENRRVPGVEDVLSPALLDYNRKLDKRVERRGLKVEASKGRPRRKS